MSLSKWMNGLIKDVRSKMFKYSNPDFNRPCLFTRDPSAILALWPWQPVSLPKCPYQFQFLPLLVLCHFLPLASCSGGWDISYCVCVNLLWWFAVDWGSRCRFPPHVYICEARAFQVRTQYKVHSSGIAPAPDFPTKTCWMQDFKIISTVVFLEECKWNTKLSSLAWF